MPADPVDRRERRVRGQEQPHRPAERPGHRAQEERADDGAHETRDRDPGRVVREQERGDDRPQDGAEREPTQGERLGGEPAMGAENENAATPSSRRTSMTFTTTE